MSTLRRLAAGGLGIALAATLASSAVLAAAPERLVEVVHISTTFPAGTRCPFEVVRSLDGTLVTTTFTRATD